MKKVILLMVASLLLIISSRWAFTSGANYELGDFTPAERMHVLDTTMIGEKWMLIGSGLSALAIVSLILAIVFYFRDRRKTFA